MSNETEKLTVSGEGPNTKISVMYRDGANYKKTADVVLAGALAQTDLDQMVALDRVHRFGDVGDDGLVAQKVLTEAFTGRV